MVFTGRRFRGVQGDKIRLRNVEWIWRGFLPRGQVILWYGEGDTGKSTGLADLLARVTRGDDFPCGDSNKLGRPANVLILNEEDSTEENIGPKMKAMGADPKRYIVVEDIMYRKLMERGYTEDRMEEVTDLFVQAKAIENQLIFVPETAVVVVDPITAFLGNRNANNNAEVKALMTRLQKIAERSRLCIVLVTHKNKNLEAAVAQQIIGSVAWWHGPRMIFRLTAINEPGEDPLVVLECVKANICKKPLARRFTIVEATEEGGSEGEEGDELIETCRVVWDDEPFMERVEEGEEGRSDARGAHRRKKRMEVMDWVYMQAAKVPVDRDTLRELAERKKYGWKRVQRAIDELIEAGKIVRERSEGQGFVLHGVEL